MNGPSPRVGSGQRALFSGGPNVEDATKIGASPEALRRQLSKLADDMQHLLAGHARELLCDAHRVMQSMACRIAIVGQVKSGKSSLINALIGQPRLLPSDVNPWTTAVTRLHSSRRNAQDNVAAEFQFFDADEWRKLAVGGGRIRELTERLVPGFEPALLFQNLEAMQKRAARRLGAEFASLLGMTHRFATLDDKTLQSYVCSGTTSSDPTVGRYSDVTKSANLYLEAAPFACPTVLIDTPGINDPYLVRDEITRQALDAADIHIVVLTARHAISNEDVALLRMLRGLNKDRLIVFVNRIDELGDLDNELEIVQTQVARGLKRERIGSDVPVIYGSSRWALNVLDAGGISASSQALAKIKSERGGTNEPSRQELLYLCSGLPRLNDALDLAVRGSYPIQILKHLAGSFTQLSQLHVGATREELAVLQKSAIERSNPRVASRTATRLQGLATTLKQSLDTFETALTSSTSSDVALLEGRLNQVVRDFSHAERARLDEAGHDAAWTCDTAQLRQALEAEFLDQFRRIESAVLSAEQEFLPRFEQAVLGALYGQPAASSLQLVPCPLEQPSIAALSRIVALDLGESWWHAWWNNTRSVDSRADALERLIGLEFTPITSELASSARERIRAQISTTIRETRAICLGIVEKLHHQSSYAESDAPGRSQELGSLSSLTESAERLEAWRALHRRATQIQNDCAHLNRS